VGKQPRNMLWYMQTDDAVESYVKSRINPMIEAQEEMRSRLGDRPEDNAMHFKRFAGMWGQFLAATLANLISKSAPFIVLDEIDAYDKALGDPKVLADVRRQFFGWLSMLLVMSHPDRALGLEPAKHWRDGIMRIYADSTRCVWYWPCPDCGGFSSPAPIARRVMTFEWPHDGTLDDIEQGAHLKCPLCNAKIWDHQRRDMNLRGLWIGGGQEIAEDGTVTGQLVKSDTAGYWIVGVMSPFLLTGIGGLARAMAKAEREYEVSGDDKALREVTVKQFGFPYSSKGPVGTVDAITLAERASYEEQALDVVPEGVRFLTCWIDIQVAHFEILVRGWGVDAESWVVAKSRVPADTATDRGAWYDLLKGLIEKRFPLATDAKRGMAIRAIGYDSGGAPGVSDRAYDVWRRLKKENLARMLGESSGRHVWTVLPTKGSGNPNAPRLSVVYPDNQKKDKKIARTGTVPLALFNANGFKDDLAGQLMHAEAGPGYVHIPAALLSKEPPHIVFEQLVSERRDANGRWTKPHQGVRNEMLDLMVGNHVLAHLHGLPRIQWTAPKAWSSEWDKNSMIAPMDGAASKEPQKPKNITDLLGRR
jgi:phage terminase large subunit GpA-like protein